MAKKHYYEQYIYTNIDKILLILIFVFIYCIVDAGGDGIMAERTHLGQHPYRDLWHILKWFEIISLIGMGFVFAGGTDWQLWEIIILIIGIILLKLFIWNYIFYNYGFKLYTIDETWQLPISFGNFIDKFLGIHW